MTSVWGSINSSNLFGRVSRFPYQRRGRSRRRADRDQPADLRVEEGRFARAVRQEDLQVDAVLPASAVAPEPLEPCPAGRSRPARRRGRAAQPLCREGCRSLGQPDSAMAVFDLRNEIERCLPFLASDRGGPVVVFSRTTAFPHYDRAYPGQRLMACAFAYFGLRSKVDGADHIVYCADAQRLGTLITRFVEASSLRDSSSQVKYDLSA